MDISEELRQYLERISASKNIDLEHLLWNMVTTQVTHSDQKRNALQLSHAILCVLNKDGYLLGATPPFLNLSGYTVHNIINQHISAFIHEDDYHLIRTCLTQSMTQSPPPPAIEMRFQTVENSEIWTAWHLAAHDDDLVYFIIRDISKDKELMHSLRKNEAYYSGIIESEIELVCRYLPDTTIVYANEAYCDYFSIIEEELIGKSFLHLVLPENHKAIYARINEVLKDPSPVETITFTKGANGTKRAVQWIDYGIEDEAGNVIAIQAVGRDITRLQRAEEDVARKREIVSFRQQLINMVSHEFRTPLTVIQTSAELLKIYGDRFQEQNRVFHLEKIEKQVQRLINLLDDVLILDKSDAHNLYILAEDIDIKDFFEDLVGDYELTKPDYSIKVNLHTQETRFRSGRIALDHIFSNLVSNAIRYSTAGDQITIDLWLNATGLSAEVTDHGIGIPKNEQSKIFDTFYRGSNVENIIGTGLGLRIVKQYVDLHRGDISVQSKPDHGTTFSVWLPPVIVHKNITQNIL